MSDASAPENARPPNEKPFQFTMRAMFVGVTLFAILLGILVALIRYAHKEALRSQCSNNLKQIVLALYNYHDTFKSFPPAYIRGPDGKPWHSWRMAILPFIECNPYYDYYSFDEPWDGPNNRKLHSVAFDAYHCPAEDASVPATMTSYLAVVGPGTAWPGLEPTRIRDFRDGTINSIIVVEVANSGIHWMEPRDLKLEDLPLAINPKSGKGISSNHVGGACVCRPDGLVHFLPNDVAADMLRSMILINDGQEIPWNEISRDR